MHVHTYYSRHFNYRTSTVGQKQCSQLHCNSGKSNYHIPIVIYHPLERYYDYTVIRGMTKIARFSPVNCISDVREETLTNIFVLLPRLAPEVVQQELDDEQQKLPSYYVKQENMKKLVVQLGKVNKKTPHFKEFPIRILSLPHSYAEFERVFSKVNDTKTKKRNKLLTKSIKGDLLSEQAAGRNVITHVNFQSTRKNAKSFQYIYVSK